MTGRGNESGRTSDPGPAAAERVRQHPNSLLVLFDGRADFPAREVIARRIPPADREDVLQEVALLALTRKAGPELLPLLTWQVVVRYCRWGRVNGRRYREILRTEDRPQVPPRDWTELVTLRVLLESLTPERFRVLVLRRLRGEVLNTRDRVALHRYQTKLRRLTFW
jgi:hypothetical protein